MSVRRVNFISEIQNKTARRVALALSLPLFLAYNCFGALVNFAIVLAGEVITLLTMLVIGYPVLLWKQNKELIRSFRLRWNVAKATGEQP